MKRAEARASMVQQQHEQKYEQQLKQQQQQQSMPDDAGQHHASEKRMSRSASNFEASSVFEEELRSAFHSMKLSDGVARPKFPILNTVGRVTLNTIFGVATQVSKATGVLIEATKETFEGGSEGVSAQSNSSTNGSIKRTTSAIERSSFASSSSSGSDGYAVALDKEEAD
jgi:hypothetical protein